MMNREDIITYIDFTCPKCQKEQSVSSKCIQCGYLFPLIYISEEIKKEAKEIIDKFAKALEKVSIEEARVERDEDRRIEKEGEAEEAELNSDFRKIMLENAPDKNDDCIVAEKGEWV